MGFCVHIHVSVYVCTHVSVCVCVRVRVCVRVSAYMFVLYASIMRSECVCVCVGEGACARTGEGAFRHPSICVYSSVPVCACGLCISDGGGCARRVRVISSLPSFASVLICVYVCMSLHACACKLMCTSSLFKRVYVQVGQIFL